MQLRSALPSLVLIAGPLAAAPQKLAEHRAENDLEFARGLATRFHYVDLAEGVLGGVEGRVDGPLQTELDLVKCEVYGEGAKFERDEEKRFELFDKAIQAYETFIDRNPTSPLIAQAERSYIDLARSYGVVLERALEDAVGDQAEALREKIRGALEDALVKTGEQIEAIPDDPELPTSERNERWRLMLNRGQMLLSLGKASLDGTFYFGQAEQILTDLAFEANELSFAGLNAYIFLGRVKIAEGELEDAEAYLEFVVNSAVPYEPELRDDIGWSEIPFETRQNRWQLAEIAAPDLIQVDLDRGRTDKALHWALHMYNMWRAEGFNLTPYGYVCLLSVARALTDAGGWVGGTGGPEPMHWFESEDDARSAGYTQRTARRSALDLALSIAQTVNADNKGNELQRRAQKVIADIISRPGVVVDPGVLMQAAEGEYNNGNYAEAVEALRRVLRSLEAQDDATRIEFGGRVMYYLGRSLSRLGRNLEAAVTFREGVTTWEGDPEFDVKNAAGYYDAMASVLRGAPNDPTFTSMRLEAENLRIAKQDEGDTGDLIKKQADRLYGQKDYRGAFAKFQEVPAGTNSYEEAVTKSAVCLYKLGDTAGAKQTLLDYMERYVTDPKNAVTSAAKIASRQKARAQATYYLGLIAYEANDYDETVRWLDGFDEAFPAQDDYGPNALYMVVKSRLAEKAIDKAMAVHDVMREKFATASRTGVAAFDVYSYLKQEQEAADAAGRADDARALETRMAEYMSIYNGLASTPSFNNLRTESNLWMELESWAEAERVLANLLQVFGEDPAQREAIEKYVKPDLGTALLRQKRVPEAFQVLDPLVPDPNDASDTRKPSAEVVETWCHAVSGWVEGDAQNIVEVPGVLGLENLKKAVIQYQRLWSLQEQFTCPWYQVKFDTAYAYLQYGQEDSQQTAFAAGIIDELKTDTFSPTLDDVAAKCGDDVLRARFLWLDKKVR